ncbi:ATPase subunit 8, partial [Tanacetum coccineum]
MKQYEDQHRNKKTQQASALPEKDSIQPQVPLRLRLPLIIGFQPSKQLLLRSNTNEIRAKFKSAGSISYARFIDEGRPLFLYGGNPLFSIKMPQLDKFTYFTQFFWSCLFLFTFYIAICNDGDGLLGISRILKLRNQLLSHRTNNIQSKDPNSLEDILRKGFSIGLSYMYSSLFEVSQWCKAVDLLGKRRKITLISCFGEISGSRGMERNILYLISKSSYSTSSNPGWGKRFFLDQNSGMEGTTRKIYSFSNLPAKTDVQK